MKKLLLFLFALTVFGACKKTENDVQPQSPAKAVAGTYTLTSFRYVSGSDEINLPKMPYTQSGQTISGTVKLSPGSDDDHVSFSLVLKVTGEQDSNIDIDQVEVRKTSEAYGLYVDGDLVADADGDNIIFSLSETDPQTKESLSLNFVAKK